MKLVFEKSDFTKAPGGDRYEWQAAETKFGISQNGNYIVEIVASAKDRTQNLSSDDDDLRLAIDDYHFGKYEIHEKKVSWKGYGTSSAWDGASLRGHTKTIFFFLQLQKSDHTLRFYADGTPELKMLKLFELEPDEPFELKNLKPPQSFESERKGIPWMSFIFLGLKPKQFTLQAIVKSTKQKNTKDGDNLKIILNGEIIPNPKTAGSIKFFDRAQNWLDMVNSKKKRLLFYRNLLNITSKWLSSHRYHYSGKFLKHSLSPDPSNIIFGPRTSLVSAIKRDKKYPHVVSLIKTQIQSGALEGQVHLGDAEKGLVVDFEHGDLHYSLHGIKKIEYRARQIKNDRYAVEFSLFDVYDFDPKSYKIDPVWLGIQMADVLEEHGILRNFEIEIQISDILSLNNE